MKLGIVGLPNVGKSTLFNAITKAGAESANYPFCTIEPNVGVVPVPDARLDRLAELYTPEKFTPAILELVDIAGLVAGASKGEGLGNQFLSHIRQVDAILHVVRCFDDPNVIHVHGCADAARDIEIISLELILADMDHVAKRIERVRKSMKGGDKKPQQQLDLLLELQETLESGKPARSLTWDEEQWMELQDLDLLSAKPILYVANIAESELQNPTDNPQYCAVQAIAAQEGAGCLAISAKIEEELAGLDPEERELFLNDLGLKESGLDRIIKAGYSLLHLISYLTAGPKEVRAWTILEGTKAPQAAGKIHSDFERGFIRAEVVAYEALSEMGSLAACKEKGLVRSEGKEYVMKDGDVVLFRFNV